MTFFESSSRSMFLFEHDLFGKPVPTFPDHGLGPPLEKGQAADRQPFLTGLPLGHQGFEMGLQFRQPALEVSAKAHQLAGFPDAVDRLVANVEILVHSPSTRKELAGSMVGAEFLKPPDSRGRGRPATPSAPLRPSVFSAPCEPDHFPPHAAKAKFCQISEGP